MNEVKRLPVWQADCEWPDDEYVVKAVEYDALAAELAAVKSELNETQADAMAAALELATLKAGAGEVVGWYTVEAPTIITNHPSVCALWHRNNQRVAAAYAAPQPDHSAQPITMPWNTPETAPKNRQILIDTGWPWPSAGLWSESEGCWVIASIQGSTYLGQDDPGYISEHERDLVGWMEMPALDRDDAAKFEKGGDV
jgi:hypothetical protein